MDKKESKRKVFNFGESPLVKQTEQTVVEGYQAIENKEEQGGGASASPTALQSVREITENAGAGQSVVAPDKLATEKPAQPAMSARQDEPTKGVQANLPLSLYNRMKRLKFETDESFQSMFQRAMDLFLDVEEGKITVAKQ